MLLSYELFFYTPKVDGAGEKAPPAAVSKGDSESGMKPNPAAGSGMWDAGVADLDDEAGAKKDVIVM